MENKKALTSKIVKQLGMFYLFNHSLYDGEKLYPITADEETLTYLGSFVEVINECADSMPNSPSVKVNYYIFLKMPIMFIISTMRNITCKLYRLPM